MGKPLSINPELLLPVALVVGVGTWAAGVVSIAVLVCVGAGMGLLLGADTLGMVAVTAVVASVLVGAVSALV